MVQLSAQEDLTGKKLEFEKDRLESWKDVFRGAYYQITVSEEAHSKLDRMHEKGQEPKIRTWIANHMKPRTGYNLPGGLEGQAYQNDFEMFCKIL